MRWIITLGTVAAFGTLTAILWNTEGRSILERFTPLEPEPVKSERIDIDTLVKMSDPQLMDEIAAKSEEQDVDRTELATFTTGRSLAFVGSEVDETDVAQAMHQWDIRTSSTTAPVSTGPRFAGRTASTMQNTASGSRSGNRYNSDASDYKYVPRMQRFGLTNTNRYGRLNAFGKRSLFEGSRFGQQQREVDRLRAKHEQYVGGRTVVRKR